MDNKRTGMTLLIITGVLLIVFIYLTLSLNHDVEVFGCFQGPECSKIEQSLSIVHFAFGVFGFLFALGFYLIVFSRGEDAIIQRLEADTARKLQEDKFSILLKGLDEFEREVITIIRNEERITQNTLALKTTMSKAKLSQVLSLFEKKGLIKREHYKKTRVIFLKEKF